MMKRLSNRLRLAPFIVGVIVILAAVSAQTSRVEAEKASSLVNDGKPANSYCLSCHNQSDLNKTMPSGETLSLYVDQNLFEHSIHNQQDMACVDCHNDISTYPHPDLKAASLRELAVQFYTSCKNCHSDQYDKVLDSVHQKQIAAGNFNAAVCTDCHNPHQQTRITDPQNGSLLPQARLHIPETCARCHNDIYTAYRNSVHGKALTDEGNMDVPTCIDCHGVHNIQDPTTVQFRNDTPLLCAKCHTNHQIMDKYKISTDVLNTYVADFHGTTVTIFENVSPNQPTNKAVCTDCHGTHAISRVDDPATGISIKKNLLVKCQACHPNVTAESFTSAWMSHYQASPDKSPLVYYVNIFYMLLIPGVIGGMLIFVISDFIKRTLEAQKGIDHE